MKVGHSPRETILYLLVYGYARRGLYLVATWSLLYWWWLWPTAAIPIHQPVWEGQQMVEDCSIHQKLGLWPTKMRAFGHQTCYFWLWGVQELGIIEEYILQLIQWRFVFTTPLSVGDLAHSKESPMMVHIPFIPCFDHDTYWLYGWWSPCPIPTLHRFFCLGDLPALSGMAADFTGPGVSLVEVCREW